MEVLSSLFIVLEFLLSLFNVLGISTFHNRFIEWIREAGLSNLIQFRLVNLHLAKNEGNSEKLKEAEERRAAYYS